MRVGLPCATRVSTRQTGGLTVACHAPRNRRISQRDAANGAIQVSADMRLQMLPMLGWDRVLRAQQSLQVLSAY